MKILYTSDGEKTGVMTLDELLHNFRDHEVRHWETDIRDDLDGRGWYEGEHDYGRYLILNLAKLNLTFGSSSVPKVNPAADAEMKRIGRA